MLYIPCDPLIAYRPMHLSRGAEKFPRFRVSVNGEVCPVRLSRESKMPFNRVWPGYQRPLNQTEQGEFAVFYGDEEITVSVSLPENPELLEKAVLRPLHKGVRMALKDGVLTFTLTQNGYFSLECGSIHTSVQIFYCRPLEDDGGASATIRFDKGVHYPGKMTVRSGDKIYIHPEAVVYGSVLGSDVRDVTVYGGGVLDDSTEERVYEDCYAPESSGCIRFFRSENIFLRDVICLNASNWVISTFDCSEIHVDGVKILGQWRYNTDGIDLVNAQHCSIRNCFIRSFDDTIVLKALYCCPAVEDITVEDCVLWCGWGKTLEIGLETSAEEYRNIRFRNCDLIHNAHGAMTVSNGNYAYVHDVTYENISVEYAANEEIAVYQETDEMEYPFGRFKDPANIIGIGNWRMWEAYPYVDIAGDKAQQYGLTRDVSYKNLYIYTEEGAGELKMAVTSEDPDRHITGIRISGLYINGELQENLDRISLRLQNGEQPEYCR